MMHMTFYWGTHATLLFDGWVTKTALEYYLSLLAIVLFGILHEFLFGFRVCLASRKASAPSHGAPGHSVPLIEKHAAPKIGCGLKALVGLLYGVNAGTSYLLMLLVMSFNGGVFIAVCAGLVLGFVLFRASATSESHKMSDSCCAG